MLNGYKTYILAAVGVIYAITAFYTNHITGQAALQEIWAALVAAGLRNALP